jgi:hypothetical protein
MLKTAALSLSKGRSYFADQAKQRRPFDRLRADGFSPGGG